MKVNKKNNRRYAAGLDGGNPAGTVPARGANLRESGNALLGQMPWGTHICQFYRSRQELLDILVPYFAAGLQNNELCIWITSAPLESCKAERALSAAVPGLAEFKKRGQLEILSYDQWYTSTGRFDAKTALSRCLAKEAWALANGYAGVRAAANTTWRKGKDRDAFMAYERLANSVVSKHRMMAICSYSLEKCDLTDLIEVIVPHDLALIKSHGVWRKIAGGRGKVEAALRASEARYQALFEASADGILIADFKTKMFSYANPAACRMFGYTEEEILKLGVRDIHPAIDLPSVISTFEAQVRGEITLATLPCLRRNGEIFYADINPAKINIDGRVYNLGIFRDISERLKTEETLKKTCSALEAGKKLLEEKNIALRETMNAVEAEKNKMRDEIIVNVNEIILPILKRGKLKGGTSCKCLDLLEKSLGALISSFGRKLTEKQIKLTSKELEVSNMIKSGLTTKEISGLLNASSLTVSKHRNNIRKKLGLSNKDINLVSFLKSL